METEIKDNLLKELKIEKWLEFNAKLNQKKNKARKELVLMGILEKKGKNDFDHYKYFTEAQYKDVANKLLSNNQLDIKVTEEEYIEYTVENSKTPIGRIVKMRFTLTDMETGFYEESIIRGEGLDRGDKAGYKAYTGAIKYYLANTFLIPTGDDVEKDDADGKGKKEFKKPKTVALKQEVKGRQDLVNFCKEKSLDINEIAKEYKLNANSTEEDFEKALNGLKNAYEEI